MVQRACAPCEADDSATREVASDAVRVQVEMDALEGHTANGTRVSFLNMFCDGTGYQVVVPVRYGSGTPTGREIFEEFIARWTAWAGMPYTIFVDQARNNLAYVRTSSIAACTANSPVLSSITTLDDVSEPEASGRRSGARSALTSSCSCKAMRRLELRRPCALRTR